MNSAASSYNDDEEITSRSYPLNALNADRSRRTLPTAAFSECSRRAPVNDLVAVSSSYSAGDASSREQLSQTSASENFEAPEPPAAPHLSPHSHAKKCSSTSSNASAEPPNPQLPHQPQPTYENLVDVDADTCRHLNRQCVTPSTGRSARQQAAADTDKWRDSAAVEATGLGVEERDPAIVRAEVGRRLVQLQPLSTGVTPTRVTNRDDCAGSHTSSAAASSAPPSEPEDSSPLHLQQLQQREGTASCESQAETWYSAVHSSSMGQKNSRDKRSATAAEQHEATAPKPKPSHQTSHQRSNRYSSPLTTETATAVRTPASHQRQQQQQKQIQNAPNDLKAAGGEQLQSPHSLKRAIHRERATEQRPPREATRLLPNSDPTEYMSLAEEAPRVAAQRRSSREEVLLAFGFELGAEVGSGSYASVYAIARDHSRRLGASSLKEMGERGAVKIIKKREAPRDYVDKFLPRELELMPRLRHPNIVRTFLIWQERPAVDPRERIFIFMELATDGDLLLFIKYRKVLGEVLSRFYMRQLVGAIEYLHSSSYCHRDIKCENVLLFDGLRVAKLADFGFARAYNRSEAAALRTFCGSVAYSAPELLSATPYDPRTADLWSLGCVLYIMMIGMFPFRDERNSKKVLEHQLARRFQHLELAPDSSALRRIPRYSRAAYRLLYAMLHPEIEQRPTLDDVAAHPWLRVPDPSPPELVRLLNAAPSPVPTATATHSGSEISSTSNAADLPQSRLPAPLPLPLSQPATTAMTTTITTSPPAAIQRTQDSTSIGAPPTPMPTPTPTAAVATAAPLVPNNTAHAELGGTPQSLVNGSQAMALSTRTHCSQLTAPQAAQSRQFSKSGQQINASSHKSSATSTPTRSPPAAAEAEGSDNYAVPNRDSQSVVRSQMPTRNAVVVGIGAEKEYRSRASGRPNIGTPIHLTPRSQSPLVNCSPLQQSPNVNVTSCELPPGDVNSSRKSAPNAQVSAFLTPAQSPNLKNSIYYQHNYSHIPFVDHSASAGQKQLSLVSNGPLAVRNESGAGPAGPDASPNSAAAPLVAPQQQQPQQHECDVEQQKQKQVCGPGPIVTWNGTCLRVQTTTEAAPRQETSIHPLLHPLLRQIETYPLASAQNRNSETARPHLPYLAAGTGGAGGAAGGSGVRVRGDQSQAALRPRRSLRLEQPTLPPPYEGHQQLRNRAPNSTGPLGAPGSGVGVGGRGPPIPLLPDPIPRSNGATYTVTDGTRDGVGQQLNPPMQNQFVGRASVNGTWPNYNQLQSLQLLTLTPNARATISQKNSMNTSPNASSSYSSASANASPMPSAASTTPSAVSAGAGAGAGAGSGRCSRTNALPQTPASATVTATAAHPHAKVPKQSPPKAVLTSRALIHR